MYGDDSEVEPVVDPAVDQQVDPAPGVATPPAWMPPPVPEPMFTEPPTPPRPEFGNSPAYAAIPDGEPGIPAARPRRRRPGLIASLVFCLVAAVAGAVLIARGGQTKHVEAAATTSASDSVANSADTSTPTPTISTPPPAARLVLPSSVNGYNRSTDPSVVRETEILQEELTTLGSSSGGQVALYINTAHPSAFVFIGIAAVDSPKLATELATKTPQAEVDTILLGAGALDSVEFTGYGQDQVSGLVIRCGHRTSASGVPTSICAWADRSTVGLIAAPLLGEGMTAKNLMAMRKAAER